MTNEEKLADAEEQYHALMTGKAVRVYVDQNGERVEYSSANSGRLMRYIETLKSLISGKRGLGVSGSIRGIY